MKKRKQAMTLLEIMIVIFLIGLIGSVIGYNMKGSLDKGRVFRTEQGQNQIHDILMLEVARKDISLEKVVANPKRHLEESGMLKDVKKTLKDGWGIAYRIEVNQDGTDIIVVSDGLARYQAKNPRPTDTAIAQNDDNATP